MTRMGDKHDTRRDTMCSNVRQSLIHAGKPDMKNGMSVSSSKWAYLDVAVARKIRDTEGLEVGSAENLLGALESVRE